MRYWDEAVIINIYNETSIRGLCNEIEDSLSSYLDSEASDEKTYSEMVDDVLNSTDYSWDRTAAYRPMSIDAYKIIYV